VGEQQGIRYVSIDLLGKQTQLKHTFSTNTYTTRT